MIKYYGTPITPKAIFDEIFIDGRNCLIPFPRPDNMNRAVEICGKIIVDNGAFTLWRQGGGVEWGLYYDFVSKHIDNIEFFFIPDVIDGSEVENNNLITDYFKKKVKKKGVPIWHINESLERLEMLVSLFDYIAIGSAGEFKDIGSDAWHSRMDSAMRVLCLSDGSPIVRIHMLRCLNPTIFTRYPFYSGDSTGLAQNHKRDGWRKITTGIEKYNSPKKYKFRNYYETPSLFDFTGGAA